MVVVVVVVVVVVDIWRKPHTSGTLLQRRVCMSVCGHLPYVLNERI